MKIVIAGAGEVGFHLIENLSREDNDISVIDTNAEVLDSLKSDLHIKTDHCNIVDSKFLKQSHLHDTDLFLAVTNSDETNMIACRTASEAGAKKTICRIRQISLNSEKRQFSLKSLGIDWIINPVSLVANELFSLVLTPNIVDNHLFADGKIRLTGYKIRDYSRFLNRSIESLEDEFGKKRFYIAAIQRKDMTIIPERQEIVQEDDIVYFIYQNRDYTQLRKILGYAKIQSKSKRVFINGGGQMGLALATLLEGANQDVKVIEKDIARSFHISEKLNKSLVLNFDGTDRKQLLAEGIEKADYFISVTDNEQVNITSCLLACNEGVERTISLVKQPELIQIIDQNTPISLGISPRILTARYLVRFIQDTTVHSYFSLINSQIEVLEVIVQTDTPCVGILLKDLELPKNVKIGAIQREEDFLLPRGETKLVPNDTLLLILHRLDRFEAMRFFNPKNELNG